MNAGRRPEEGWISSLEAVARDNPTGMEADRGELLLFSTEDRVPHGSIFKGKRPKALRFVAAEVCMGDGMGYGPATKPHMQQHVPVELCIDWCLCHPPRQLFIAVTIATLLLCLFCLFCVWGDLACFYAVAVDAP